MDMQGTDGFVFGAVKLLNSIFYLASVLMKIHKFPDGWTINIHINFEYRSELQWIYLYNQKWKLVNKNDRTQEKWRQKH